MGCEIYGGCCAVCTIAFLHPAGLMRLASFFSDAIQLRCFTVHTRKIHVATKT